MIPANKTIVYVTRDIERAIGLEPGPNYLIVANETAYSLKIKEKFPNFVTLIKPTGNKLLGTTELIGHQTTKDIIAKTKGKTADSNNSNDPLILVFKNSLRVETMIKEIGCQFVNPKSFLAERVENKLSQIRWLGDLARTMLPSHTAKLAKLITWKNEPFIMQWAHGHTGDGTMLIHNQEELSAIQAKFPERIARLSNYIQGPSFTVNVVVTADRIMMGNISYQITGLPPFTDNPFSTVGNDWALAKKLVTEKDLVAIRSMVEKIGLKLKAEGWLGLFGLDVIREEKSGRIFLIEVNARQPASTTFESALQAEKRKAGYSGLTTFEAHIRALLGLPIDQDLIEITDGSQIIQRITANIQSLFDDIGNQLEKKGYDVVVYENTELNSDLIRIQSHQGIMDGHGLFNVKGHEIVETIKSSKINIGV